MSEAEADTRAAWREESGQGERYTGSLPMATYVINAKRPPRPPTTPAGGKARERGVRRTAQWRRAAKDARAAGVCVCVSVYARVNRPHASSDAPATRRAIMWSSGCVLFRAHRTRCWHSVAASDGGGWGEAAASAGGDETIGRGLERQRRAVRGPWAGPGGRRAAGAQGRAGVKERAQATGDACDLFLGGQVKTMAQPERRRGGARSA